MHVLIGLHIAHWQVTGRTLAPLEFNEVMHTLELGLVTAGFLLMVTAVLTTAVFGRFFCGWACHMLALQDLCAWLLGRFGVQAKPVRSRVLRVAPWVVMGYMFVWPQLHRLLRGAPAPRLRVAGPEEAWASFATEEFWRNLPGPWITGLTLLVCGFVIVYVLGSRAFCLDACPYGALFALADRVAPGRIRLRGNCTGCGQCTRVCQSGIQVHEEVRHFGTVVDPACLRDMDCVAACSENALSFGFGKPAGLASLPSGHRRARGYHRALGDDLIAGVVMLAAIFAFRGLYGAVPFLMAVGVGCIAAGLVLLALRLRRSPHLRWRGLLLRRDGRTTGAGVLVAAGILACFAFGLESAFVRWHEWRGLAAFEVVRAARAAGDDTATREALAVALEHHHSVERWGLWNPLDHDRRTASLLALRGDAAAAVPHLERIAAADAGDHEARLRLAYALRALGRDGEASEHLSRLRDHATTGAVPANMVEAAAQCADGLAAKRLAEGDVQGAVEPTRLARELRASPAP